MAHRDHRNTAIDGLGIDLGGALAIPTSCCARGSGTKMTVEVTIIGAGPYGLSLAAHLDARHIAFRIFGIPMEFWSTSMPHGMLLKSEGCASSIYDPRGSFTLARYCADANLPYADLGVPVPLETFASYGLAFQQRLVPGVEQQRVTSVATHEQGFVLNLADGKSFTSHNVVLAVGVGYFAYTPPALAALPEAYATHSSQHADLSAFVDRDVAIVGGGASALDLAALLNRIGARPVLITRKPGVEFHERQRLPRSLRSRLIAPTSGIGPGWHSWLYCHAPLLFHALSERRRLETTRAHLGPAGGWFIKDEVLGKVPLIARSSIDDARMEGDRVRLRLVTDDGATSDLTVDHVIAATGFRVDVDRLVFLDDELRGRIDTVDQTPILSSNFESTAPGLYFVGAAAANSFGPVQRFAVGARFAARRVTQSLARKHSRSASP